MTKYSMENTMTTSEKVIVIRYFLDKNYPNLNSASFTNGWHELLDLYGSNNLSHEFRMEMEKEINSIYNMVIESEFSKKKEKRIPALHTKGILCRFPDQSGIKSPYPRHFLRVNDDSKEGFTDYAITHHDLEIMILDGSAEFVQNEKGNFLDYTKEAMSPA